MEAHVYNYMYAFMNVRMYIYCRCKILCISLYHYTVHCKLFEVENFYAMQD